jgi:hypothetical protein
MTDASTSTSAASRDERLTIANKRVNKTMKIVTAISFLNTLKYRGQTLFAVHPPG